MEIFWLVVWRHEGCPFRTGLGDGKAAELRPLQRHFFLPARPSYSSLLAARVRESSRPNESYLLRA